MYKVGFIGYGQMGKIRHRVISSLKNTQVISIYDQAQINTEVEQAQNPDEIIKNSEISRDKFFKLKEGINPNTDFSVKSNDLNHGMLELFLGSKLTGYFTNRGRIENNKSQDKEQK